MPAAPPPRRRRRRLHAIRYQPARFQLNVGLSFRKSLSVRPPNLIAPPHRSDANTRPTAAATRSHCRVSVANCFFPAAVSR